MPYINSEERPSVDVALAILREAITHSAKDQHKVCGVMNYAITNLLQVIPNVKNEGRWNYDSINSAIGVLDCTKLELYRRLAGPYEDRCIEKSGDVEVYENFARGRS